MTNNLFSVWKHIGLIWSILGFKPLMKLFKLFSNFSSDGHLIASKYYKKTLLVKMDWSRFTSIRDNWKILLSALNWNDKIISVQSDQIEFIQKEPVPSGRVDGTLNFYAGGLPFQTGILPVLKMHVGNNDWVPYWPSRDLQVSYQRGISGNLHHLCLCQVWIRLPTVCYKPRGDITRSPNQGYQFPYKRTFVHHISKKVYRRDRSVLVDNKKFNFLSIPFCYATGACNMYTMGN